MQKLTKKLNELTADGIDKNNYDEILRVSQELDKYIAKDIMKQSNRRKLSTFS